MTADEVEKYINQVAFSGAEEFLDKYKDSAKDSGIIGHFGLGFYSAFMVAEKVEIITKSYKDEPAAHWTCDGSPEFTLERLTKLPEELKSFCISQKILLNSWKNSKFQAY
jgi:molecular chaperone HtpG